LEQQMSLSRIPVIDISGLGMDNAAAQRNVAAVIGKACRGIGFFYVVGHGVPPETVSRVFDAAADFFRAPGSIKDAVSFSASSGNRGFIRRGAETLELGKPADVKEAFNIGLELGPTDPDLLARKPFRASNMWPEIPEFRTVMLDYYGRMREIGVLLHRAFALDLGLDAAFFADKFRKPMATLRLLHYPPVQTPIDDELGAGEHTDYGNVTLLAADSSGLRVRDRDGHWLDAPVVPGAFICNIGDCLMRWTNDVYVSTPHKVVSPPARGRHSVAFFLDPDPDAVVACLPTCCGAGRPSKYPAVLAAEFLKSRLDPTYARSRAV
jgi:isopenicillin N synthase-like dioxygenase